MFEPKIIFTRKQYEEYYSERFIYGKELSNIVEIMKTHDNYRILIVGAPGSGKSTLLNLLSYYTANKNPIEIIRGYTISNTNYDLLNYKNTPCFLDGLDEIKNPYGLLHFLNEKKCNKLICTSRPNLSFDGYFTHIITLNSLTHEQIMLLIQKLRLNKQILTILTFRSFT